MASRLEGDLEARELQLKHDDVADFMPKVVVSDGGGHRKYETNFPWLAILLNNTTDEWLKNYGTGIYIEVTSEGTKGYKGGITIVSNHQTFDGAAGAQGFACIQRGMGTVAYFRNASSAGGRCGPLGVEFEGNPNLIATSWSIGSGGLGLNIAMGPGAETDGIGFYPREDAEGTCIWISSEPNDLEGRYRHTEIKANGDIKLKDGMSIKRQNDQIGLFERVEALERELAELKSRLKER